MPGPMVGPYVVLVPTLDAKNFAICGAECSSDQQVTTFNPAASKTAIIYLGWCADLTCNNPTSTSDVTSISNGVDTFVADNFCAGASASLAYKLFRVQSTTGGSHNITVQWAASKGWYGTTLWSSWSNIAASPFDQAGCGNGTSTTITAVTSGNVSQSNELVTAVCGGGGTVTPGAGFTKLNAAASNLFDMYEVGGTSGSTVTATCTQANHAYTATIGTYKHL